MAPLKVCINAQLIDGVSGGVQQIVVGLAQGLSHLEDGDEEYLFRCYQGHAAWLAPFVKGPCRIWESGEAPGRALSSSRPGLKKALKALGSAPLLWRLNAWRKGRLLPTDGSCEREGVDVLHFPYQEGFLSSLPSLYQPHDLQHLAMPGNFSAAERGRREMSYRGLCKNSWATVLMSRWGKRDLMRWYGLPSEKVAVVPGGAVTSAYPEGDLDATREKFSLPDGFFYYPAHTFKHKNHARLLEAMALLKAQGMQASLVCSGGLDANHPRLLELAKKLGIEGQVIFTGYVSPQEVSALYGMALAMVFPSLYEGWGLPLTEAMDRGLPIACSNATCVPEQVADAALLFDALDPASIAAAMRRMMEDAELRASLVQKGKARVQSLTWLNAAKIFRALYRKAGGREAGPGDNERIEEAFLP